MPVIVKDVIDEPESIIIKALIEEPRYSFRKRKMPINEEEVYRSKIIKAIIAIINSLDKDDIKLILIITQFNLDILILRVYKEAVNDKTYGQ